MVPAVVVSLSWGGWGLGGSLADKMSIVKPLL